MENEPREKNKNIRLELIILPNPYLGDDMRNLPLGLLYLAAVTEKEGYSVKITDLRSHSPEKFNEFIGNAEIYGITAATPDYPLAKKIAEIINTRNPKSWIILGGVHATAVPEKIDTVFNKIVIGEGEIALIKILKDYEQGNNNQRIYVGESVKNLDDIPFPARHLLSFKSVFNENALFKGAGPTAAIITSRGCPNNCSFCASNIMWHRQVRFRSPDNVIAEMKDVIKKYGVKNFRIMDDTFTLNKPRLKEMCEKIKHLDIRWRIETRVDYVDQEILRWLKEAGCEELAFGIESPNQEVLDRAIKGINLEQAKKMIRISHESGLATRLFFIIGLPGEKPDFADRFIKFIEETNPDAVDLSTFVPYPGSDIYCNPKKYGIKIKDQDFSIYNISLGLRPGEIEREFTFEHDVMTNEQLITERKKALEFIKSRKMVKNF